MYTLPMLLMFPARPVPDPPLATFADTPNAGWGPISGCEEPCLANWSAIYPEDYHYVQKVYRESVKFSPNPHNLLFYLH
jgi:hypothetical protein